MSHNAKRERPQNELLRVRRPGMGADLAALTPPLVMGGAFVIGVVIFLRRQMGPRQDPADDRDDAEIEAEPRNADPGDPTHGPSTDQRKV
jgi:hypothetical protein